MKLEMNPKLKQFRPVKIISGVIAVLIVVVIGGNALTSVKYGHVRSVRGYTVADRAIREVFTRGNSGAVFRGIAIILPVNCIGAFLQTGRLQPDPEQREVSRTAFQSPLLLV
ncbi:hypothetical protein [Paenibacillus sp. S150]|uniref:hypothetical protein n=1 Tax=Paenibacillus sp. S150 TaxID=2749826 RepID=UPI001C58E7FC|nr:hypothetical protein [Paenibacillus sp. S150]MBW4083710.1 hypothetical protein [Paenibacillus sp. S150]